MTTTAEEAQFDGPIIHETDVEQALIEKQKGNEMYAKGNYDEAIIHYTEAIDYLDPDDESMRDNWAIFHGNRAAAFMMLNEYDKAIVDCNISIENKTNYVKVIKRRSRAYEALKKYTEAQKDLQTVCEIDPNDKIAAVELHRVTQLQEKQMEEQKAEMMGKLKELGNSVLGKFGMSLDNFKTVQDPKTGSYSISFDQGAGNK